MPKGFRKQLKLTSQKVGVERRQEILDDISDGNGFLPQGVHIKDMDEAFVDFVKEKLKIEIDGEEVPVIFLTIQRYSDFTKTWKFTDEYKNIQMPFITIVRNPDIQKGTNQAGLANIPGHRHWTYYKVPTNDGARVGMDIYKIPQPTAVDITYEVRFFSNKMSDVNVIHNKVQKEFNAIQSYIFPKGHPMPITIPTIGDESNIEDFESRRFYVQMFEMLLAGYVLDENDFVVTPTVNRAMVLSEISVDPATGEPHPNQNARTPVIRMQGSVIIRNSAGTLIGTTDCNSTYVVGNSNILNSGSTFSVFIPATSGYTLPNVINYDSDGLPVLTPAMVGFTASTCAPATIVNSGSTYSASTPSGTIFELPNETINLINNTGGTLNTYVFPVYENQTITATTYCAPATIINSGSTYSHVVASDGTFVLPNTPIFSTLSGFTSDTPSVSTGYTIADNIYTDSDGSTGNTSEYGQVIICTPNTPCPPVPSLSVGLSSSSVTFGTSVTVTPTPTNMTAPITYTMSAKNCLGYYVDTVQVGGTFTYTCPFAGTFDIQVSAVDSLGNRAENVASITVGTIYAKHAITAAWEGKDSVLVIGQVDSITDATGNGNTATAPSSVTRLIKHSQITSQVAGVSTDANLSSRRLASTVSQLVSTITYFAVVDFNADGNGGAFSVQALLGGSATPASNIGDRYDFGIDSSLNKAFCGIRNSGGGSATSIVATNVLSDGRNIIVMSYDGATLTLIHNGVTQTSAYAAASGLWTPASCVVILANTNVASYTGGCSKPIWVAGVKTSNVASPAQLYTDLVTKYTL